MVPSGLYSSSLFSSSSGLDKTSYFYSSGSTVTMSPLLICPYECDSTSYSNSPLAAALLASSDLQVGETMPLPWSRSVVSI